MTHPQSERSVIRVTWRMLVITLASGLLGSGPQAQPSQFEVLIRQLQASDPSVRGAAFDALKANTDPAVVPPLLSALLAGGTEEFETNIATVLERFRDPRKIGVFISVMRRANAAVNDRLMGQLSKLGAAAIAPLVDSVSPCLPQETEGPEVWETLAFNEWVGYTLGAIPAAVAPLLVAAKNPDPCLRAVAMLALGDQIAEDTSSGPALLAVMLGREDPHAYVSNAAMQACEKLRGSERFPGPDLAPALMEILRTDKNPSHQVLAIEELSGDSEPVVVDALREAAKSKDAGVSQAARAALERATRKPGPPVRDLAAEYAAELNSPDPKKRLNAIGFFHNQDQASDTRLLIPLVHDPDAAVRTAAVTALGSINAVSTDSRIERETDYTCVPPLVEALDDTAPEVREAAAAALGDTKSADAVPALSHRLRDPEVKVVVAVIDAIGRIGAPGEAVAIAPLLKAPDSRVRSTTAYSLSWLCNPETLQPLLDASYEIELATPVGNAIACILEKGTNEIAVDPLIRLLGRLPRPDYPVIHALGKTRDPKAIEPLVKLLADRSSDVRRWTADALGDIADPRAIPALTPLLKDRERDVRSAAAGAFASMRDFQPPPDLIAALTDIDPWIRLAAAKALAHSNDSQAIDALAARVPKDPEIIWALGESKDPRIVIALGGLVRDIALGVDARLRAVDSLERIATQGAIDSLRALLTELTTTTAGENVRVAEKARTALQRLTAKR